MMPEVRVVLDFGPGHTCSDRYVVRILAEATGAVLYEHAASSRRGALQQVCHWAYMRGFDFMEVIPLADDLNN